jgi:hypothetical protein
LVLRLYQETVHDFILLFMPPCGPQLTPLAIGSLERSLLVFSTPGGLTGDDLSRLFFTCTNTSQAATCTCNTQPRISPHNIVNHSSHKEATIHRSSNHTWSSPVAPEHLRVYPSGFHRCWSLLMGRSSLLVANAFLWGRVSAPAGLAPEDLQERECSCRGFFASFYQCAGHLFQPASIMFQPASVMHA